MNRWIFHNIFCTTFHLVLETTEIAYVLSLLLIRVNHYVLADYFEYSNDTCAMNPEFPPNIYKEYPDYHQIKLNKKLFRQQAKLFPCQCGRSYSLVRNYNYHLRWECGRDFTCSTCSKSFKDLAFFRKHCKKCVIPQPEFGYKRAGI